MALFNPPKGTQDIYGNRALSFAYIEDLLISIAEVYGFIPMRTPTFEQTELFERGVGDSSDIVRKEMYTFLDKGNRSLTLRPEGTAGVMRAITSEKLYATNDLPLKYYYVGKFFRYERPQLGRFREFHSFGVESVGSTSPYRDAEVILLGVSALKLLGLKNITLKINTLGDEQSRLNYKAALKAYFKDHLTNMCADCHDRYEKNPLRILDCKVPSDQEIVKGAPNINDYLSKEALERFNQTLAVLDGYEIDYEIDDLLVRGLDYYSHVVFEFHYVSNKGKDYGALGAGGHYETLLEDVGGPALPGVGFGMGIERLHSVLSDDGLLSEESAFELDFYIMNVGETSFELAFSLLTHLRSLGYISEMNFEKFSFRQLFKRAERKNAKYALIIGDDEVENEVIQVKDLHKEKQVAVAFSDLSDYIDTLFIEDEHNH